MFAGRGDVGEVGGGVGATSTLPEFDLFFVCISSSNIVFYKPDLICLFTEVLLVYHITWRKYRGSHSGG